jgi:predicted nucleic acid-binding protein
VILVEANILIYPQVGSFLQHDVARHWLDEQIMEQRESAGHGRVCWHSFVLLKMRAFSNILN